MLFIQQNAYDSGFVSEIDQKIFLFIFYCLSRILIGKWEYRQMSSLIQNIFLPCLAAEALPILVYI